ncbi:MAG: mucoidy inhibitor MuiA family protein [Spirochaetes bacterium]|nr:mucoidy inhibitor MuiA family protein [Spirochaetota bacterium]
MKNQENSIICDSTISEVTVYFDRAMITRQAKIKLTKGEHLICFDDLPDYLEQNSIQVKGKGSAVLKDIQFREKYFTDVTDDKIKSLQNMIMEKQDIQNEINQKIMIAQKEQDFVESIINKLTQAEEKENTNLLDPDKWIKMTTFYRSKLDEINKEIREAHIKNRDISKESEKLSNQLNQLGNATKKKNIVEVLLEVTKEDEIQLDLTYLIYGPTWYPVYDLRVSTPTKKMKIGYQAMITQNTGEDWPNVALSLSTAQAHVSAVQPQMNPWYLNMMMPEPLAAAAPSARVAKKAKNTQMFADAEMAAEPVIDETEQYQEPISIPDAMVNTQTTSVIFQLPGRSDITSDNIPHKALVMLKEFPASFRYSTIPKLSAYAYLKAKVKNETDFPFLPGETNIFLDNNFVAHGNLDLVSPSEEFWTFLGIDEGLKVEHKLLKKYYKKEGLVSKKSQLQYEFLIKVTNNKKTAEEIVIWDQIPISEHQDIKVNLIEPKYKENNDQLKMNELKFLEWFFKPEPGKVIEIPLVFTIEFPRDKNISGLY